MMDCQSRIRAFINRLLDGLDDWRADRRAVKAYKAWKKDPTQARSLEEFETEWMNDDQQRKENGYE